MTSPAAAQLNRIVQMVAELTRREREGGEPLAVGEIAARLGVTERDVERDLRTLTSGGDSAEHDWLGSLSVIQEGGRVMVASQGPFRRPIRLTPEELLAIQVGLAEDPGGRPLSRELAALLQLEQRGADRVSTAEITGPDEAGTAELARRALNDQRCLEIVYAGSKAGEPARRVIEVQQVVRDRGHTYLVAWCRRSRGRRTFRADRVLEARLLDERSESRDELFVEDGELFQAPDDGLDQVEVHFSPTISRWLAEAYPNARQGDDGGVTVRFDIADPAWLVRTVLQYGEQAEVIGPAEYRSLMLKASS